MPRRLPPLAALALLAVAAPAGAQEGVTTPTAPLPPVAPLPVPAPTHPALTSGWAVVRTAGETLRAAPGPAAAAAGMVPSVRIAGRAQAVTRDTAGEVWVRVAFPDAAGWVPGEVLSAAAPPAAISPATRRVLMRQVASMGPASALVVRDPLGRTLFAAGTTAPLRIASVTKLATVAAALERRAVPLRQVASILGPSDNVRAQALSTTVVGGGGRALGARRATDVLASFGAVWRLVDGSGLSPSNRASAGEVADMLLGVREAPRFRTLFRALPVAAHSGTLEDRMGGTAAAGRVRAKTGSLFDTPTSALAGYIWPAGSGLSPDRALVMVMLVNQVSPYRARPVQDAIAASLAAPGALTRG